jgi:hypothetical protein
VLTKTCPTARTSSRQTLNARHVEIKLQKSRKFKLDAISQIIDESSRPIAFTLGAFGRTLSFGFGEISGSECVMLLCVRSKNEESAATEV